MTIAIDAAIRLVTRAFMCIGYVCGLLIRFMLCLELGVDAEFVC